MSVHRSSSLFHKLNWHKVSLIKQILLLVSYEVRSASKKKNNLAVQFAKYFYFRLKPYKQKIILHNETKTETTLV